ncbi:hypothetical protein F5B19DRAFT_31126 [Rostrohypoxylon terebratum]|nr:hypothetical protein F5B19DRAFT_31126 [Rostrohypoxylon terebratum]
MTNTNDTKPKKPQTFQELIMVVSKRPPNLQQYLDDINLLVLMPEDCEHHGALEGLKLGNLKSLTVARSIHNTDHNLLPYLQPQLESLFYYGGPITNLFFQRLQFCCPSLKELLISNPRYTEYTSEGLRRYVEGAKSLRTLQILCDLDRAVTCGIFCALAKTSALRILDFRIPLTTQLIQAAVIVRRHYADNSQLFSRLQRLVCITDYKALLRLLPHLHSLIDLEVSISGQVRDLFAEFCRLDLQLRFIQLEFLSKRLIQINPLTMHKFVKRRAWDVEKLSISGENLWGTGFTTPVLDIMERATSLKILRLWMNNDLNEAALLTAATCGAQGRLTELDLGGFHDLALLMSQYNMKIFKFGDQFKALNLGRIRWPSGGSSTMEAKAAQLARFLMTIAPTLVEFNIRDSWDTFSSIFKRAVLRMIGDPSEIGDDIDDKADGIILKVGPKTPPMGQPTRNECYASEMRLLDQVRD